MNNSNKKKEISFFARPYFFAIDRDSPLSEPCLHRGTSLIRGEQIAEYLGARYNPTSGYENDVCIYLKPKGLDHIADGSYVDVSDGSYLIPLLQNRPNIKLIASSQYSYDFIRERLNNDIVLIPEHHCNFERLTRDRNEITTVGFIGSYSSFNYKPFEETERRLAEIGLKFITNFTYRNRQDVVDFYRQIDIMIFGYPDPEEPFRHPTRIVSAASFGIPTVCNRHPAFKEFEGYFITAENTDSLLVELKKLKDQDYYRQWAARIVGPAEQYHISTIAEKYKQLVRISV